MLLRSKCGGEPFEGVEPVYERYVRQQQGSMLQLWRFNLPVPTIAVHERLRLQVDAPAIVHWSAGGWMTVYDTPTDPTGFGVHVLDFPRDACTGSDLVFTFYWPEADHWEGRDFVVKMRGSEEEYR